MNAKMAAANRLRDKLSKKYGGEGTVMLAKDIPDYDIVSTGSIALDFATGIGGVPTNRVIDAYGLPGTGKSTLAYHLVNNFLKRFPDKVAVYMDIENRITPQWLGRFVEDMDRVIVIKPDTIEDATDIYVEAAQSGEVSIIVLDSIGGAPSDAEVTKSAHDAVFAGNAKGVTRFARRAQAMSGKYGVCTLVINQLRVDMGGYNRDVKPGGTAIQHALSLSIRLRKGQGKATEKVDGEDVLVGNTVAATITKNSLGSPNKTATYWFFHTPTAKGDVGIDSVEEVVRLSTITGVIEQRGAWFYHESLEGGKAQGKEALTLAVKGNAELREFLSEQVRKTLTDLRGRGAVTQYDEDSDTGEYDFTETREV